MLAACKINKIWPAKHYLTDINCIIHPNIARYPERSEGSPAWHRANPGDPSLRSG
ncbi:hypothetical protein BN59_01411 [Legionella massiliensis]|uniref:Uncharacterized protein n=1 Tax=Legionella massiliensis TaxID=1034943 RepID=A0A078KZC1_9GAMM|nr:hypothetical protein BN59_01411 [Legionella massiliensis]CEE12867.1 hypothetical protein BN1094_01411 [Legionella massiliensis]